MIDSRKKTRITWTFIFFAIFGNNFALADAESKAKRLHIRITGVPGDTKVISEMKALIEKNENKKAAEVAIQDEKFLTINVFDMFSSFTNEDGNNRVPLNDYTSTVLGIIRDDLSFKEVLTGDIIYLPPLKENEKWSPKNNDIYKAHQVANPVSFANSLTKYKQSDIIGSSLGLNSNFTDFAGIMSTRAFAVEFYFDGTNRAALNSVLDTYICRNIESLSDSSRPDYLVRQDVERSPGANSSVYLTQCVGCHAGMDSLGGAFAYFDATDVEGVRVYSITPEIVHKKFLQNSSNFPDGFVTENNSWINLWAEGTNKAIGWRGKQAGNGINDLGKLITETDLFPECMSRRVYSRVCMANLDEIDEKIIKDLSEKFVKSDYKMKNLFAEAAVLCLGE